MTQKTSVKDTGKISLVFHESNSWLAGVKEEILPILYGGT